MNLEKLDPQSIKKLSFEDLDKLSKNMKEFMIDSTAITGGILC